MRMMEIIVDNSLNTFCCAVEYTQDKRFPVDQCADKCLASTSFHTTPLYNDNQTTVNTLPYKLPPVTWKLDVKRG